MDEVDFGLCMSLVLNSRVQYKELAEIFKMSINSIHKRIKSLVEIGVIQNFNTKLSLFNFPSIINVVLFGNSNLENKNEILDKLGEHESIFNVTRASGNLFYVHAHIKDFNGLDPLVSFVQREGGIKDVEICLGSNPPSVNAPTTSGTKWIAEKNKHIWGMENKFSNLDFLIIDSLKDNSRKPITDVAKEVGATPKTVRRRLKNMAENNLLHFSIDWYPDKSSIIVSIIILKFEKSGELDKSIVMEEVRKEYTHNIMFSWNFSNLPNLMLLCVWTSSMQELQGLEAFLLSKPFFSVNATVLVKGKNYPSWRDNILEEKIQEIKSK